MLIQDGLGVFLALAAGREQRVMEGGAADEVAALLSFLLLERQIVKLKRLAEHSHTATCGKGSKRRIHVSTYTNFYLSSSEVRESKRLGNLI